MTSGPSEPPDTARRALTDALRLLAGRDFSRAALAERLRRRGHDPGAVAAAVARCADLGYLDDHAYGSARAQGLLQRKPCGRRALVHDLRRQGLTPTMCQRVASEVYAEAGGEEQVLGDALRRWIQRHGEPDGWPALKRCSDHLARRGFSAGAVRAALSNWFDEFSR